MYLTEAPKGGSAIKTICDHCGNESFQSIKVTEVVGSDEEPATYTLSRCTICNGIILRRHEGDWNAPRRMGDFHEPPSEETSEQLWPDPKGLSGQVPDRVRKIYSEARKVRVQSSSSFVVQIRRALEAIAKDKDASGGSLYQMLQDLVDKGELPGVFAEMSHISRMIGNLGAHDAEEDVTAQQADTADSFFLAIVEYLYVAPELVKQAKAKFQPPGP